MKKQTRRKFSPAFKEGSSQSDAVDTMELYAQIGQLKAENEFLKKSCAKPGTWISG